MVYDKKYIDKTGKEIIVEEEEQRMNNALNLSYTDAINMCFNLISKLADYCTVERNKVWELPCNGWLKGDYLSAVRMGNLVLITGTIFSDWDINVDDSFQMIHLANTMDFYPQNKLGGYYNADTGVEIQVHGSGNVQCIMHKAYPKGTSIDYVNIVVVENSYIKLPTE